MRASLTSAWVALVYDLIAKYRELGALGDAAATAFIQSWDAATAADNLPQLLQLERTIIKDATVNTQIVNRIAQRHLERLREDRNFCTHPAFSAEAELFEPSPELVRLHLVNVVNLILSREPLQGRAIFDLFDVDVQSTGFPTAHARILDYVQQRYLERVRAQNIRNFGTVLAKSLLRGVPPQWEPEQSKIVSSLVAVRERTAASWPDVASAIIRLIDNLEPENRPRAIAFIAAFPGFWPLLHQSTRTALQETVDKPHSATLTDFRILAGVNVVHFRDSLLAVIAALDRNGVAKAIAVRPLAALWPRAVQLYGASESSRGSEANFRDLIAPFARALDSGQHDQLLDAVIKNVNNWDATDTPSMLLAVLRNAPTAGRQTHDARNRFYHRLRRMRSLDRYKNVLDLLQADGWTIPPPQQNDEEYLRERSNGAGLEKA